jgi:hypothetical protein
VQQAAQPVATADAIEQQHVARGRLVYWRRLRERRPLGERAVRPVSVVVPRVDVNDAFELAAAKDQQPVEALAAQASTQRSACARARGARTGALITRIPSERKTSSKLAVNLLSLSRIKNAVGVENPDSL